MDRPLARLERLRVVRGVSLALASVAFGVSTTACSSESCAAMLERLGENHAEMTSGTLLSRDRSDLLTGVFGGSVCSGGGMLVDCEWDMVAESSCSSADFCSRVSICDIFSRSSEIAVLVRLASGCIDNWG